MKTPALIEAIFQIDAKAEVVRLCTIAWSHTTDGERECLAQYMPTGMSPQGAWTIRVFLALVLIAGLIGIVKAGAHIYSQYRYHNMVYGATMSRLDAELAARYVAVEGWRFAWRTTVWLLVMAVLVTLAQAVFQ